MKSFLAAAEAARADERTLLGLDRLWILWQAARNVAPLDLPAVEVGTFRGGSAYFLATAFLNELGHEVPIDVVDTFEGHPGDRLSDADAPIHEPGHFGGTSYEDVRAYLSRFERVTVRKGEFSQVAPELPHAQLGFVHLDMDLYRPTQDALAYFAPRLAGGGVIVVDDYEASKCKGIRRAAHEFLASSSGFQAWNPLTEQLVLVKTR